MAKKIKNWKDLLKMMKGRYFKVGDLPVLVKDFEIIEGHAKIHTDKRPFTYPIENIHLALLEWVPLDYNGVAAINIFDSAVFEDDEKKDLQIQHNGNDISKTLSDAKLLDQSMVQEGTKLYEKHTLLNDRIIKKYTDLMEKLDGHGAGNMTHKDLTALSQMTRDITSMQLQELRDLANLQKSVDGLKQSLIINSNPDENSDDNKKD